MTAERIRVACSPDADDLFMMWALLTRRIDPRGFVFDVETEDTDALNQLAEEGGPDVSAISVAWYPHIWERYQLLPHGGSVGEGYGPALVAKWPVSLVDLANARIGVPGLTTTAYGVLRQFLAFEPVVIPITPPERVFEAVSAGRVDAAVVIHEGRLTYADHGLHLVADLGQLWAERTGGLPLPLGANAIRRDLGPAKIESVSAILRESIAFALAHRDGAIDWLLERKGLLDGRGLIDRYLAMYANNRTLDYGEDGRRAIVVLLRTLGFDGPVDFSVPINTARPGVQS